VPITDGWFNVFRLSEDEPVQDIDPFLEPGDRLFGGGGGPVWMATTIDQGIAAMDEGGCERAVLTVRQDGRTLVMSRPPTIETGLEMVSRAPDRLRLALQLDDVSSPIAAARAITEFATLDEACMVGVWPSFLECDITDRRLYPAYAACVEARLPVRINVGIVGPAWSSTYQNPMLLEQLMIDFPELVAIGAHMGHPWETLMMRLIMKFENLHLMTSAYLPKYFDPALVKFMGSSRGRGRIMYASDFPMIPIARAVEEARKLPLSEEDLDLYLGTALCNVLGWK